MVFGPKSLPWSLDPGPFQGVPKSCHWSYLKFCPGPGRLPGGTPTNDSGVHPLPRQDREPGWLFGTKGMPLVFMQEDFLVKINNGIDAGADLTVRGRLWLAIYLQLIVKGDMFPCPSL